MASGKAGIIAKIAESIFKVLGKDAEKAAAKKAAKEAEEAAARKAAQDAERHAIAQAVRHTHDPRELIPKDAERKPFKVIEDGSEHGVNHQWKTETGQTVRFRAHSADRNPDLPATSNSASGPTYRVQVGGRYVGKSGKLYEKNAHKVSSPFYDPNSANDTHIPWPPDIPLPW